MHECRFMLEINNMQKDLAVLKSRVDGVEVDIKNIKDYVKDNTDDIKDIKECFSKTIIGGLGAAVVILIGIIVNIFISLQGV